MKHAKTTQTDPELVPRYLVIVTNDKEGGVLCMERLNQRQLQHRTNYLSMKFDWRSIQVFELKHTLYNRDHGSVTGMEPVAPRIDDTAQYRNVRERQSSPLVDTIPDETGPDMDA